MRESIDWADRRPLGSDSADASSAAARSAAARSAEASSAEAHGPPIACSLDASSLSERLEEWRILVATSVSSIELDADSVRFALNDSDEALLAAASLGTREKACCAFFDVAVELESTRRVLRLRVPAGAAAVLAEFVEAVRP